MEIQRARTIKTLVSKLSSVSERTRTEAVCELRLISKHEPESRPLIIQCGAIPYLSESLLSSSHVILDNASAALLNLSISDPDSIMSTRGILDNLSHALLSPSYPPSAVQSLSATLYSLLVPDRYRPIIGSKRDIVYALVSLINTSSRDSIRALFGISLYPPNRPQVISLGAVSPLFARLGRIGRDEDTTAVIAQIAGCEEAWEAFDRVDGVRALVDFLQVGSGSSVRVRENAVSALYNLVQFGLEGVLENVRGVAIGAVNGIADVAEVGTEKGKARAVSLLKMVGDISSSREFDDRGDFVR